jgi:GNAT superfamily N-acetyltransferase
MNPRYDTLTAPELAQLTEDNLFEFLATLGAAPGATIERTPDFVRYADPAIMSPMFNGVIRASFHEDTADTVIADTLAYFAEHERPLAFWWVGPTARPADLGARLLAHSLVEFEVDAPSMAVDLHALPAAVQTPEGFMIEPVRDEVAAQAWGDTFNAIYGTPAFAGQAWVDAFRRYDPDGAPFQLYLGRLNGEPVATNILTCAAGAAGVLGVGTLPAARGQGIGAAITLRPYLDARDMGYHIGVLFATELGASVYRRLGFRDVGVISRYLWRAA